MDVGIPQSTPSLKFMPAGSVPDSVIMGTGSPLTANVNVSIMPSCKTSVAGEMKEIAWVGAGVASSAT